MPANPQPDFDVQSGLAEFADLNRRRLFGSPSLAVEEVERWLELRSLLECHFGAQDPLDWTGIERREFLRLPTHIRIDIGAERIISSPRFGTSRRAGSSSPPDGPWRWEARCS